MKATKTYFKLQQSELMDSYLGAVALAKTDEPDPAETLEEHVRALVQREFDNHLVYANETFYTYRDGYWPSLDARSEVRKTIALSLRRKASPQLVSAYYGLMQDLYAEKSLAEPGQLVCLVNGTLDPISGRLESHRPVPRLRSKLDIAWDQEAQCPRFVQFLGEIFEGDVDKAQKISCLQQFFGYCLIADTSMHKFLWAVGPGGNGKSVLLEVLTNIIGPHNVSHAHIDRLEEETVRAELEGKLINISFEMTSDSTLSGGHFKAIVSGDRIEARRLYQRSFSFKPYARLVCATNDLPRLNDLTAGFARRAIIIRFNRIFTEAEQDKQLAEKLLKERAGILAWAVQGLKVLRTQGRFTIPESSMNELAEYRKEADSVHLYVEERLSPVDAGGLQPSSLYSDYRTWCGENGFGAVNKINFGKRLARVGIKKRKSNGQDLWLVAWRHHTLVHPIYPPGGTTSTPVIPIASRYRV